MPGTTNRQKRQHKKAVTVVPVVNLYLMNYIESGRRGIQITSIIRRKNENIIPLKLNHPDDFGPLRLRYLGPRFHEYFPPNSTFKVRKMLLEKRYSRETDIININTNKENDCRYLFEKAVKDDYQDILAIQLEIMGSNYLSRLLTLYLHGDKGDAIKYAVVNESLPILKALLNYQVDINLKMRSGWTPLLIAINQEMPDLVKFLISNGADVNIQNDELQSPLHFAIENNNPKILNNLFESNYKLNVNPRNEAGWTPLHVAIALDMSNIVDLLISKGADVNIQNNKLQSPLHFAARKGNLEILNSLLKSRAKLDEQDNNDQTPLHVAVTERNIDVVKIMLKEGANYKLIDSYDCTPLHLAAQHNNLEMIEVFLENNVDADILNSHKQTPLFYASQRLSLFAADYKETCLEIINAFLQKGANVNHQDVESCTPLHYAVINNNNNFVQALLECNADVTIRNNEGENILHLACRHQVNKCLQVFLDCDVDMDAADNKERTALHVAAESNNCEAVQLILEKNSAIINASDRQGKTALHLATEARNSLIVELLLRNGANVDLKDESGTNALGHDSKQLFIKKYGHILEPLIIFAYITYLFIKSVVQPILFLLYIIRRLWNIR